jgi:hypothetical protein
VQHVVRLILSALLLFSAVGKTVELVEHRHRRARPTAPSNLPLQRLVIGAEYLLAVAVWIRPMSRIALVAISVLFVAFAVHLMRRSDKRRIDDCGCFGAFAGGPSDLKRKAAQDIAVAATSGLLALVPGAVLDAPQAAAGVGGAALLASVVANIVLLRARSESPPDIQTNLAPLPPLEFTDGFREEIRSGDRGILFVAPDCAPCMTLLGELERNAVQQSVQAVVLGTLTQAVAVQKRFDLGRVAADPSGLLAGRLGVTGTPALVTSTKPSGPFERTVGAVQIAGSLLALAPSGVSA